MAADTAGPARNSIELKSASLPVVAVLLHSADPAVLAAELAERLQDDPGFFDNDAVLIDITALRESDEPIDFAALCAALRGHATLPVAVRGGSVAQMAAAAEAGLAAAPDAPPMRMRVAAAAPDATGLVPGAAPSAIEFEERRAPRQTPLPLSTPDTGVSAEAGGALQIPAPGSGGVPTVVMDKPLRSGQQVYARGADLVVLAVVSFGAEVIADGNIHVYAPLRGRAIAGARGNTDARIFTTCLEPQLVSIAGFYRTTETELADNVRGKPAQIRLDGEKLIIEPLA